MKARAQLLKVEHVSGTAKATGNPYDLNFAHFLDKDNYDKFRLMVSKEETEALKVQVGKEGVLDVSVNPKTDKLEFSGFKAAA